VNWYAFDNNVFETNQPIVNNYPDLAPDQAISMQAAAADPHGEPTIVMINDYTHWVITRGGYWDVLATSQPSANIIQYHDPLDGPDKTPTVAQWKDYIGNPVHNVGIYYQQHAVNGLQVFYNYGGTYYGDPDPPVCDPPESCEPLEAGLLPRTVGGIKTLFANLFSQPGTSSASRGTAYTRPTVKGSSNWVSVLSQVMAGPTHRFKRLHQGPGRQKFGPRKYIYVPHPYTHKESEIIDNCLTGLRQSKMDQLTAYAPLTHDPSVTVSSIREVKSKTATPDYYLLTFSDGAGRPFASAAVSEVGWLLEAGLLPEGRISPTEEAVSSIVEKHGKWGAHGLRWLMIASSQAGCTNTLSPMAVMDSDDGSTVVVNSRGQAYQQDPNGEITVKTHDGGSFGLRRLK
jgi:hypothetical protein